MTYNVSSTSGGRIGAMCNYDEMLFTRLCDEFENNIKESKGRIDSQMIREFRRYAREYSVSVYDSEPYSDESFGDQGIRSDALVAANLNGDFDMLLRSAFISEQLGKYSFDNYDEPDKSISHLLDALFLLSSWLGLKVKERYNKEVIEIEVNRRLKASEDGKVGGKIRAKKFLPFKVELIRLLFENAPDQGWKSTDEAISAIEVDLFKFIEIEAENGGGQTNHCDFDNTLLLWDNLGVTINRWVKEDEIIKTVFDKVIRP